MPEMNAAENKVLEDLKAEISDRILGKLPEEFQDAELKFVEVTKNNDEKRNAVLIQKDGQNVTPTIYLDPYVKGLEEDSVTVDQVLDHIALPAEEAYTGSDPVMAFAHMIQEVNANEVPDDEILGTVPYHYDKENGFELASKFEERQKSLEEDKVLAETLSQEIDPDAPGEEVVAEKSMTMMPS